MNRFEILKLPDGYSPNYLPVTINSEWNEYAEHSNMNEWIRTRNAQQQGFVTAEFLQRAYAEAEIMALQRRAQASFIQPEWRARIIS